ncbi:hypothetical protein BT96DRAFT_953832 [Gymnopus androsaceus JB14]|uniref:Helitron helicase-like domain-containing protein n=1 Tax=Gymnopus androsaceus JB14 TaxID=1447944 RepID=A0A6A4IKK8_9AGAR|nr:hypothetical protein BT96DRAFT_953832 [Gymnopus androsaceus JB14]
MSGVKVNLWKTGEEGAYAIHHVDAVSDFGHPQRGKEDAFPFLFPYGHGGVEANCPNLVDFGDHIKSALWYHDGRFCCHKIFLFTAFGIQQCHQGLGAAHIQAVKSKDAQILSTITEEKLKVAQVQEEKSEWITDPAILLLKSHIHAVAGKIWSTSIVLGPPSIWITINPCNLHDLIAQVFAGEELDLDKFLSVVDDDDGIQFHKQAQNIVQNPYTVVKFFHFLVKAVLQTATLQ